MLNTENKILSILTTRHIKKQAEQNPKMLRILQTRDSVRVLCSVFQKQFWLNKFQNVAIFSFYKFFYDVMHCFTTYKFIYCIMLLLIQMILVYI